MWDKIVNVRTGEKVNVNSKIGKYILKQYLIQLGGHTGPCALNTNGSRCKKNTKGDEYCHLGPTGRCRKNKLHTPKKHKQDLKTERYVIIEKLTQGGYGETYEVKSLDSGKIYVLKVQEYDRTYIKNEIKALKELKNTGIVVKLVNAWNKGGFTFMIFEDLVPCRHNYKKMVKMVSTLLNRMHKKGWVHGDAHSGNVMCNRNGEAVLIDLGEAKDIKRLHLKKQKQLKQDDFDKINNKEYFSTDYKDDIRAGFDSYWKKVDLDLTNVSKRKMLI